MFGWLLQTGYIDYDKLEEKASDFRPKMIICGGSAYPREWDYKRLRQIADKVGALLMSDMAHIRYYQPLRLILGPSYLHCDMTQDPALHHNYHTIYAICTDAHRFLVRSLSVSGVCQHVCCYALLLPLHTVAIVCILIQYICFCVTVGWWQPKRQINHSTIAML